MFKTLLIASSYAAVQGQQVIDSPLPGKVTKTNANLYNGLNSDFKPTHVDLKEADIEHLKAFRPALKSAERGIHVEIDNPIIGVLELPMNDELEKKFNWTPSSYVDATHVKYLESAGARVTTIPYDLSPKELEKLMNKLNGVYIPGDSATLLENNFYSSTISEIIQFAQKINEQEGNHFPVAAFEYGALTLLQDAVKDKSFGKELPEEFVDKRFHYQALKKPDETFLFDSVAEVDLEETFIRSIFYNELEKGVTLNDFMKTNAVLKVYNPTVSLKESGKGGKQIVSAFEAHSFPFYGFMIRTDQHQFAFSKFDRVDHSAPARNFAQMIADHIVDEARLSKHTFKKLPKMANELDLTWIEEEDGFQEFYLF